jgi:hypothetical protein
MDFTNGFYVPVLVNSTPRYLCCFTTSRGAPLIVSEGRLQLECAIIHSIIALVFVKVYEAPLGWQT